MPNLAEIKRRLTSVKQTRQITSAMETVSVAKMRKAVELCESANIYYTELSAVMRDVMSAAPDEYVKKITNGSDAIVVLSTDKGLCGGFDHEIIKFTQNLITGSSLIFPVGSYAEKAFKSQVDTRFCHDYIASYKVAKKMGAALMDEYGKTVRSITLVYNKMTSRSSYTQVAEKIFPIEKGENGATELFEPSFDEVYNAVLPLYLYGRIYCALLNNYAAEHSARRAAMSAATKSADEMINSLTLEYNRARQSSVTEQIIEIIGATSAIGAKDSV